MNNTLKELSERKSVRVFLDKEVSLEVQDAILEAAFQAPTAGNMQMYSIINITDQELLDKLAVSCDNQPFISTAKFALVFMADYQKWIDTYKIFYENPRDPNVGELLLGVNDALIAAQNAVVAAESLGIGSCYIGDIMEKFEYHKELLNLPQYTFPVVLLVFGYPSEQQKNRKKPLRFAKEYMVHENTYKQMNEKDLESMFNDRGLRSQSVFNFELWLKAFYNRKYNTDFSVEMSRSINRYIEEFKK